MKLKDLNSYNLSWGQLFFLPMLSDGEFVLKVTKTSSSLCPTSGRNHFWAWNKSIPICFHTNCAQRYIVNGKVTILKPNIENRPKSTPGICFIYEVSIWVASGLLASCTPLVTTNDLSPRSKAQLAFRFIYRITTRNFRLKKWIWLLDSETWETGSTARPMIYIMNESSIKNPIKRNFSWPSQEFKMLGFHPSNLQNINFSIANEFLNSLNRHY